MKKRLNGTPSPMPRTILWIALCFLCIELLTLPGNASDVRRASDAIPATFGDDPSYLYVDLPNIRRIAKHVSESAALDVLTECDHRLALARKGLLTFPATDMALLIAKNSDGEKQFHLALRFDDRHRALLRKIEDGTAETGEIGRLFGEGNLPAGARIEAISDDNGHVAYRLGRFGLHLSAKDGVLVVGDGSRSVEESFRAMDNRFGRFNPKERGGSPADAFAIRLDRETTGQILGMYGFGEGDSAKRGMTIDGKLTFVPGGWDVDLFTNASELMYGRRDASKIFSNLTGPFPSAGGGRLALAADSTPNTRFIVTEGYAKAMYRLLSRSSKFATKLAEGLASSLGKEERSELFDSLLSLGRLNAAITYDPANPKDVRAYAVATSRTGGMGKVGAKISDLLEKRLGDEGIVHEKIDLENWDAAYALRIAKPLKKWAPKNFTLAFDDKRLAIGLLPPALLTTPFSTDSAYWKELSENKTIKEWLYMDMRALRKIVAAVTERIDLQKNDRLSVALLLLPFVDFREITSQTFSERHTRFNFRTGWLDLDDRAFLHRFLTSP